MTADQFLTVDGRPTVRVERRYPHPIEKVWRAVTTPEHLGAVVPEPGRDRAAAWRGDALRRVRRAEARPARSRRVDAPRLLAFTWGADRLTFELEPDGDGTTFALTHTFDDRYGAASFATGWEMCLAGLRSVLADEPLPPPDRGIARHEELVHEFGLDRPEVTESAGGWTVRFERQLTCPADVAWDMWFGKDRVTGEQRAAPAVGEPLTPYMAPDVVIGTDDRGRGATTCWRSTSRPTGGPGDHVRVEFAAGTGHGARITLTVTGTDPAERDAAVEMWGTGAIGHLAATAAEWALSQPVEA